MPHHYRQPPNEDDFEEFCLTLLREHWNLPTLNRYGRRGERQHGVDLLDTGGGIVLRAVQCKHHDQTKTLPPKELADEVEKASGFPEPIGEFYLLTTAKKSVHAQKRVRTINREHTANGRFVVHLLTWDDVERIIDDCPAGQDFLGVQAPHAMRRLLRTELQPIQQLVGAQGTELHAAELDDAKKRLEAGQIDLVLLLLGRLRDKSWDQMIPRHRWRYCTLLAECKLRRGEDQRAAELLIEGKRYQPDDTAAICNEIVAHEMLGDRSRAWELAQVATKAKPLSGAIYSAAIHAAPNGPDAWRLFTDRPGHLKENPEVWLAVASREDLEAPSQEAEATARRATILAPDDPRGWQALGSLILRGEFEKEDPEGVPTGEALLRNRIEEAVDCLSRALDASTGCSYPAFHATTLLRRATARALLGDNDAAGRDIDNARRVAPTDAGVVLASARFAEERGDHTETVRLLREVVMRHGEHDEARFFLGVGLWNRNDAGDRVEAVDLLAAVGIGGSCHVEAANELAIEGMLTLETYVRAEEHLRAVEAKLDPCLCLTLRSRLSAAQAHADQASRFASEAVRGISDRTSRATLRKLAKLLVGLGRPADALPLWDRLVVDGEANDDGLRYVECAARLGRHGKVLAFCAAVRKRGTFDERLLQWELRLLDRYDPDEALSLLRQIIERDPKNRSARIHLVHLALRLGRSEVVEDHVAQLPAVSEVDAEDGSAVVAALSASGRSAEAVSYSYDLLRRHFQDHHTHRAFRNAVLFRDRSGESDDLEVPLVAAPGVAVSLTEEGRPAPQWFVLEDSDVPASGVEDELRPDSPLAERLVGKRVGDEVFLTEGPGLTRKALIQELVPKRTFRVRDVVDRWQYRFPEHQEMWMVRVARSDREGELDLSSIFELAKERRRQEKEAEALYTQKLIPISLFGEAINKTEIHAVAHVACTDGLVLRCCVGSLDEYQEATNALRSASEVVLDTTALMTLMMLGEPSILGALGKTVILAHSTMANLRAFVEDARSNARSEMSMGADDEGPRFFVKSVEGRRAALDATEGFLRAVEEKARVLGCPALADHDPSERKQLEEGLGRAGTESLVLGAVGSRVVWTDDYLVAVLGRDKFGARRVWTQAVLRWLNEQGRLSNERYAKASAQLLGWQFMFTSVNPEVMRVAGHESEWHVERWPLKQAIAYLSVEAVRTEDAALLSARLVAHGYLDAILPETRRILVQAIAESLAKRVDAKRALDLFGSILPRVFGLNLAGRADAVSTYQAWLREYLRRVLPR
jgi:tetratricopeptide (TPR) repeat protein